MKPVIVAEVLCGSGTITAAAENRYNRSRRIVVRFLSGSFGVKRAMESERKRILCKLALFAMAAAFPVVLVFSCSCVSGTGNALGHDAAWNHRFGACECCGTCGYYNDSGAGNEL